ncbi:MAG TPA: DUF4129 domain-containing protein, partial [Gemmataceae bacterium]|nr:DUF4129 domain-containing protein [Gemmataceae bacterium]
MAAEDAAVVRPRTTGELLDDAWRLYLADAPILLLLSSLFLAPAFAALLLLTDLPAAADSGLPGPAYAALWLLAPLPALLLLVLSGVGSGACQEWFRARAEGRKTTASACLAAAFRQWAPHTAARALALIPGLLAVGALLWLSTVLLTDKSGREVGGCQLIWDLLLAGAAAFAAVMLWPLLAPIHAYLASTKGRSSAGGGGYLRLARADSTKAGVLTLMRLAVLALAVINLYLLIGVGLWILDSLAGLDAAFIGMQLTIGNPFYDFALFLFAWLLLAPFFEACNFLLHVDARSRQEGLDLQLRVQRVFPTAERKRVGALAVLLGLVWLTAAPVRADATYDAVHAARLNVERIALQAGKEAPYNGRRWQSELNDTAGRLGRAGVQLDWFEEAIEGFADRSQGDALLVLGRLDERLALLEDTYPHEQGGAPNTSKDDLKKRLEQSGGKRPAAQPSNETEQKQDQSKTEDQENKKDKKKSDDQDDQQGGAAPAGLGVSGCGPILLILTIGLTLAVVVVGTVMFIAYRRKQPAAMKESTGPVKAVRRTAEVQEPLPIDRPAAELWREADELARKERYRDAVRSLYHAVLSLLHSRQLLRYERTRTNGEYVQQVRLAPQAPPALHAVFQTFTNFFESKWYGDPSCDAAEYRSG